MPRNATPEDKAAWAAYMRKYRSEHAEPDRTKGQPTARQIEVLRIYADPEVGGTEQLVADYLGISKPAVHNHLQRLMRRLGVRNHAQAVVALGGLADAPTIADPAPDHQGDRRLRPNGTAGE
jgi:DNA-binding NarL/FixJ family response regulator